MANPKPLQIFRAGKHTAMSGAELAFSESDLAASAAAYDPTISEAPIVVGHPAHDAPAYGWVKSLAFAAGGLEAQPDQVDPAFAEMVAAGRFKKISASFYPPASRNNPVPGVYYLRHVGFLGAMPPAVKGLRTPAFAESDEAVTLEVDFSEQPNQETVVTPEEKAALEAENAQLKQKVADAEAATKALEAKHVDAANAAFTESLIDAGKLFPADRAAIVATMNLFAAESPQFTENGTEKSLLDAFKTFLSGLPTRLEFGEFATEGKAAGSGDVRVEFAAPQGYAVDVDALAIHRKAIAHQAEHKTDYLAAVKAVSP
jgi:hypothetical protein